MYYCMREQRHCNGSGNSFQLPGENSEMLHLRCMLWLSENVEFLFTAEGAGLGHGSEGGKDPPEDVVG